MKGKSRDEWKGRDEKFYEENLDLLRSNKELNTAAPATQ